MDKKIEEIVRTICVYYSKLKSSDVRRKKITSKYRELELLTDIKSSTIRQWTDTLDPYFDNERRGYHQRDLETSNKNLFQIFKKYKDYEINDLEKIVESYFEVLRGNKDNELKIENRVVHLYSIKTRDENIVNNILNGEGTIRINRINWFKNEIKSGDYIFLILGGDRMPWNNGLIGISVVEDVIIRSKEEKNFEIDVKLLLKLPVELTPEDFYYYPNIKNVINIGPALKGTPNQAINRVPYSGAISIFGAIVDIFSELELSIRKIIGDENFLKIREIPKLQTKGELERKRVHEQLNIDFEGSVDLIDYTSLSDDEKGIINVLNSDSNEEIKNELMEQSSAVQKNQVNISRETLSVYDLYRKYTRFSNYYNENKEQFNTQHLEDSLILEPDFQRNFVWTKRKNIELVESILLGIPLPTFYFSEDMNGNFLVVDGKQRLNAIFEYLDDQYSLDNNYSFLVANGKSEKNKEVYFRDLQSKIQRKIEDFSLNCYVIGAKTSPILQNEIFIRVNRGGVPLNQQEIRNASNVGLVTMMLLNKISENEEVRIVPLTRKKDQYLALRYFAFYLVLNDKVFKNTYDFSDEYENMDNFLDLVMKYLNRTSKEYIHKLYTNYLENIKKSFRIFDVGEIKRFTRSGSNSVNMNIFEVWMLIVNHFTIKEVEENTNVFIDEYNKMVNDEAFLENILYLRDKKEKILSRLGFVKDYQNNIEKRINT